jgi:hypothetical protein
MLCSVLPIYSKWRSIQLMMSLESIFGVFKCTSFSGVIITEQSIYRCVRMHFIQRCNNHRAVDLDIVYLYYSPVYMYDLNVTFHVCFSTDGVKRYSTSCRLVNPDAG